MQTKTLTDAEWRKVQDDLRGAVDVFRGTYTDDANNNELREETDEYLIFADGSGHELSEIAQHVGVDRAQLSQRMHAEARKRYEGDGTGDPWGVMDPVVIIKDE